ncbi:MAG: phosphatase PAP2 family protein [Clostridia bacterium]|nr:phosphatase PAP2 family protein [Clostridia bacterium]
MFQPEFIFLKFLESIRTPFLNNFFEFITILGEETVYIFLICIIYFMFDKKLAQKLFFIASASIGLNCVIKNIVKLPRPFSNGEITCIRPETATGYSFPSGHTQIAATCTSAIAIVFKKNWTVVFAIIATTLVGFSRMYLGAHFPLDVISASILGVLIAFILNNLHDKIENKDILYLKVAIISTIFAIIFMINPNVLFLDFYKFYGLFWGFICAVKFEEKFVNFNYDCSKIKKIFRVIIGALLAYILKVSIKLILVTDSVIISYIFNTLRYFVLVIVVFAILPLIFKIAKM